MPSAFSAALRLCSACAIVVSVGMMNDGFRCSGPSFELSFLLVDSQTYNRCVMCAHVKRALVEYYMYTELP